MASHTAIAAVSRTLQTLLLDRMVTGAAITLAPPDVEVTDVNGARVNLYLMQVIENGALKNQEIPGQGHPAAYGHPPLSLDLRYLVTTHSAMENQAGADLNAQTILGDAMRVMNDFGNRIDQLTITNPVAGTPGDPILDPDLAREFERLKIVLHPAIARRHHQGMVGGLGNQLPALGRLRSYRHSDRNAGAAGASATCRDTADLHDRAQAA